MEKKNKRIKDQRKSFKKNTEMLEYTETIVNWTHKECRVRISV